MPLLSFDRQGSGPTLVWLHGFTQTRASAHQYRSILAGTNELLTLDLPGHGSAADVRANLEETADLISASLPPGRFALGGYSYGARVALHIAIRHPERLSRLVLIGATRGIEDRLEREARRVRDEVMAQHLIEVGTEVFLDEWLAQPLFSTLAPDEDERNCRSRDASGLASSLRLSGTGTQQWLAPKLRQILVPTLCLAGSLDVKFSFEAEAIAGAVPLGTFDLIEGAGHSAHLEKPLECARRVADFLAV